MMYPPQEGFRQTARRQSLEDYQPARGTRSGRILRRMLRKIASGETEELGDTSTLAVPAVLEELLKQR